MKDGDCVVTDLGTGFVLKYRIGPWAPIDEKILLDGGRCVPTNALKFIQVIT